MLVLSLTWSSRAGMQGKIVRTKRSKCFLRLQERKDNGVLEDTHALSHHFASLYELLPKRIVAQAFIQPRERLSFERDREVSRSDVSRNRDCYWAATCSRSRRNYGSRISTALLVTTGEPTSKNRRVTPAPFLRSLGDLGACSNWSGTD
jgi:hypothetical protein